MRYLEDKHSQHKDRLIQTLRAYNRKYTGEKESSTGYFYAVDGEELVGCVYADYSWDWVSLGSMFYANVDVLTKLISEVGRFYGTRAAGMKLFTEVESRADDFLSIGFERGGMTEPTPKVPWYSYLKSLDFDIKSRSSVKVLVMEDKNPKYHSILEKQIEIFDRENHVCPMEERKTMFVALDSDRFAGGILGTITEDLMYIDWLAVEEEYRGKGIGRSLLGKMEEKAKEENVCSISLGTTEFQAEKFYEKNGYRIVFIKENDPRGYKSFSMVKDIRR